MLVLDCRRQNGVYMRNNARRVRDAGSLSRANARAMNPKRVPDSLRVATGIDLGLPANGNAGAALHAAYIYLRGIDNGTRQ